MKRLSFKQKGASLPMAIIMLVTLTILVVSMANMSSSQFKTITNVQARNEADAAAKESINIIISSQALFNAMVDQAVIGTTLPISVSMSALTTAAPQLPSGCSTGACLTPVSLTSSEQTALDTKLNVGYSGTINGYDIRVSLPFCYGAKPAAGYSATSTVSPEDTHWVITAKAYDSRTGVAATVSKAVKVRMGAGNCGDIVTGT